VTAVHPAIHVAEKRKAVLKSEFSLCKGMAAHASLVQFSNHPSVEQERK